MKNRMIFLMKYLILALISIGFSASCGSKQMLPVPTGQIAPDTARIVLERKWGFVGGGRSPTISDNGVEVGDIANGDVLSWDRPAGTSCLTALNRSMKLCFEAKGGRETHVSFSREGFALRSFDAMKNFKVIEVQ